MSCKLISSQLFIKKSCLFDTNNYRPIFILPVVFHLFQRLLCRQLTAYPEDNNLLSPMNHGFRVGRLCLIALMSLTNCLFINRGQGHYNAMASLVFSKAFDCLSHDTLLEWLRSLGLSNSYLTWFC